MKRQILVKSDNESDSIAILEEDVLVEYLNQKSDECIRGTILLGLVKEYQPSLDAYFIDVGTDLKGFLPGKFTRKKLKTGTQIVLQIVKPVFMDKGMTLSTILSISGKYCVITSNHEKLRVSAKIKEKHEQARLMNLALNNCPKDLGLIIRTNATTIADEIITDDISLTTVQYKSILETTGSPGEIVYKPEGIVDDVMRSFNSADEIVYFNDMDVFNKYFKHFSTPGKSAPVKYYNKDYDMFEFFGIANKIKQASGRKVWLKSGGTLIFDYTEAMCVIDVNTSKNTGAGNFSDTAYKTNMEAAKEIAVQIRLRNIGGIIIIDFIDMDNLKNKKLDIIFRKYMENDRKKMAVGGFTTLGNYEITRIRKGRRLGQLNE